MPIILSSDGVNRQAKSIPLSVNGTNVNAKSAWAGVGGVNQQVFSSGLQARIDMGYSSSFREKPGSTDKDSYVYNSAVKNPWGGLVQPQFGYDKDSFFGPVRYGRTSLDSTGNKTADYLLICFTVPDAISFSNISTEETVFSMNCSVLAWGSAYVDNVGITDNNILWQAALKGLGNSVARLSGSLLPNRNITIPKKSFLNTPVNTFAITFRSYGTHAYMTLRFTDLKIHCDQHPEGTKLEFI